MCCADTLRSISTPKTSHGESMNATIAKEILDNVTLPFGLRWGIVTRENGLTSVQVGMVRPDTYSGQTECGWGPESVLGSQTTDDALVKKVFGLAKDYLEHELREGFLYKDRRIFGPHISLDALYEAAPLTTYAKTKGQQNA